jgi:hypothetical protein
MLVYNHPHQHAATVLLQPASGMRQQCISALLLLLQAAVLNTAQR